MFQHFFTWCCSRETTAKIFKEFQSILGWTLAWGGLPLTLCQAHYSRFFVPLNRTSQLLGSSLNRLTFRVARLRAARRRTFLQSRKLDKSIHVTSIRKHDQWFWRICLDMYGSVWTNAELCAVIWSSSQEDFQYRRICERKPILTFTRTGINPSPEPRHEQTVEKNSLKISFLQVIKESGRFWYLLLRGDSEASRMCLF